MERIPYSEIEKKIDKMNFSEEGRTLKKNVAVACFALMQSQFKQNVEFFKSDDPCVVNLHYTWSAGDTVYKRIMSIPYGIVIYNEICDKLGLE